MQSFDVVTLRTFLAVLRTGSIGAAARTEHIAASAISRRISDLEKSLDITLIRRTPGGVVPTPAGRVFGDHCETILGQMAAVRADLGRFAEGDCGELRIGAVTSVIGGALPDLVRTFRQRRPGIRITLNEIASEDGARGLREDRFDLVIISDTADTRGFTTRLYGVDPVWVIAPPGHDLFKGRPHGETVAFRDTTAYGLVHMHVGGALDELISTAMRKAGAMPARRFNVLRFESLRCCVRAGLGLGFARQSSVMPFVRDGTLLGAPLADDWANRRLTCVFPGRQGEAPLVNAFLSLLDERT